MSPTAPAQPPYDEAATFEELVFALGQRDQPTVALIECASLAKRRELEAQMAGRMPEYQFVELDLTPYAVTSLLHTLNEKLAEEVRTSSPVTYLVNVHGLENSQYLSEDGRLVPSPLIAQLNLERELLFRSVPYLIVLWGDAEFFRTLQRKAPDFWHWVTYRFRFEDHTARPVADMPPLPPERLPGRGNVVERQARIKELQDRYDHLALDDSDKKRLLKNKIDILSLLGEEYTEAFLYREAEDAYKKAIALQERMRESKSIRGRLWYNLADVYLSSERLTDALNALRKSRKLLPKGNGPALAYQIGRVYKGQRKWKLALANYQKSLQGWRGPSIGLHQSMTYLQIGSIYQEQKKYEQALQNYQQALSIGNNAKDAFAIGESHHYIGRMYEQLKEIDLAVRSYEAALPWQEKGNSFNYGWTCHQLGRVYEVRKDNTNALSWYGIAVHSLTKYGHPFLPMAQQSLARIAKNIH